jgi:hypothetical protein
MVIMRRPWTSGEVLSLGYSKIAREDSETNKSVCQDLLKELGEIYCHGDHEETVDSFLAQLKAKVVKWFEWRLSVHPSIRQPGVHVL